MNINLELYRSFITVAEKRSFTGAADALYLTQSAVSQAVKQLEAIFGVQLFIRSSKGASLTEAGEMLYARIGGVLEDIRDAERYFDELKNLEAGTLKIGASDTLCRHMLLPVLKEFHEKFPFVEIQVTNRTSGETAALVNQGKADIGFINLPVYGAEHLDIREIAEVHDCFICGEKYFSCFEKPIPLSKLQEYPILMLEGLSASRKYVDEYLSLNNAVLKPQIELGSLDLLIEFAANNLGVAAVIKEFLGGTVAGGGVKVIELECEIPARSVAMIKKKDSQLSFAGREFVEILQKMKRTLTGSSLSSSIVS